MRQTPSSVQHSRLSDQAVASRRMKFANRREEVETISAIDHKLNVYYWNVERHLVENARETNAKIANLRSSAVELTDELHEMEQALLDGKDVDLDRWLLLDARVPQMLQQMESLARQFLGHHQRLSDVPAYVDRLQDVYPALHRPVVLPYEQI